jgi:hypothetical protein
VRKARRRAELARLEAEIEDARPYLDLAREIQREVARVAADGSAGPGALAEVFDGIDQRERARTARAIFDRLPPDQQWAIIERVFGDEEIGRLLADQRAALVAEAPRMLERATALRTAQAARALDVREVPRDEQVSLGLFRETDVRAAVPRGHRAANCARRLVLSACEPGAFRVIEDVFNPEGDYFVTAEYDEETWRASDRLPAHAIVRPGSLTEARGDRALDPVLHLGGRVDFSVDGELRQGRLHLGFALFGDQDVFVD